VIVDSEIVNRHHPRQTEAEQGQRIGGTVDQLHAVASHPQRHHKLRPKHAGPAVRIEGEVDAVALAECPDQRLDVAADTGSLALAKCPGV
jgi:hypothetical protein